MVFSTTEVETEGCQVRRRGQWRICLVTRGQWRVFCSAVWLHEVSGVSSAQLFGYTRMSVAGLLLSCWLHEDGSDRPSAQLLGYTRSVADLLLSCSDTRGW